MRKLLLLAVGSASAAAMMLAACVGDDVAPPASGGCDAAGGCTDATGPGDGDGSTTADGGSDGSTSSDAGVDGCTGPCNGDLVWLRSFGSTAGDQIYEMSVDGSGNIYLLASAGGTLAVGDDGGAPVVSAASIFVAKLDPTGKALWAKPLGGSILQYHLAVSSAGNVFIAGVYFKNNFQTAAITWDGNNTNLPNNVGTSGYDIFVIEVDSTGTLRFAAQIGADSYDEMRAVGVDNDGSPVIFGQMAAAITYRSQAIAKGPFVLKLDANSLNPTWVRPIGVQNAGNVRAVSIVAMQTGDIGVTGTYGGEVNWTGTFTGSSTPPVATDTFVVRLKSGDGSLLPGNANFQSLYGDRALPSAADTEVSSMAFGNAAGTNPAIAVVGQFHGWVGLGGLSPSLQVGDAGITTRDPGTYLVVFNSGTFLPLGYRGIYDYGGTTSQQAAQQNAKRVAVDKDGNVALVGAFNPAVDFGGGTLTSAGAADGFVTLYEPNLQKARWSKRFGGPVDDRAVAVAVDPTSSAVIVAGEFKATADFPGGKQLTSNGGVNNLFLMKLAR